jgi:hypothetical protein
MRCSPLLLAATVLALSAAPSYANKAAADACAAKLPANAKLVYAATIGSVGSGDLKETVRGKTRSLVMSGKLSRGSAKAAATSAGECLKLAR